MFVWSGNIKGAVSSSTIAVANGAIYASTSWGGTKGTLQPPGVTALNAESGSLLWNNSVGSIQYSSPAVASGVVFVGSDNSSSPLGATEGHSIYALNVTTGATIWTYRTGGPVYSSPAVAYGVVYVGSNDGKVYAIGTSQNTVPSPSVSGFSGTPSPSVPEFPTWIILPLFASAILLSIVFARKRNSVNSVNRNVVIE